MIQASRPSAMLGATPSEVEGSGLTRVSRGCLPRRPSALLGTTLSLSKGRSRVATMAGR